MPGTFLKIQDGRYNCIYAIYLRGNDTCPVRVLIKTPARACNRHSPPSMCIFHSVANPLGDFDRALARSVFIVCITVPGATDRGQQCSAAGRRPRRSLSLSLSIRHRASQSVQCDVSTQCLHPATFVVRPRRDTMSHSLRHAASRLIQSVLRPNPMLQQCERLHAALATLPLLMGVYRLTPGDKFG